MLANADIIEAVAEVLEQSCDAPIVLDPVMVATSGDALIDQDAVVALKSALIPMADVITPNIPEAEKLSRKAVLDMEAAAEGLIDLGARAVYLKGGHLKGDVMRDVLATSNVTQVLEAPRVDTENTHGTGCTLSSAIAAYLGRGENLADACEKAKAYLTEALKHADALNVGLGHGPVHHGWAQFS